MAGSVAYCFYGRQGLMYCLQRLLIITTFLLALTCPISHAAQAVHSRAIHTRVVTLSNAGDRAHTAMLAIPVVI